VSVITVAANRVTSEITQPGNAVPSEVAFAPNGKKAFVTNDGGLSVSVITVTTDRVTSTIPLPYQYAPLAVTFSPNSKQAYVTTGPNNALLVIREN
jgi:YVTN family beta-propeller protein